jgi:hypothetical protein
MVYKTARSLVRFTKSGALLLVMPHFFMIFLCHVRRDTYAAHGQF